MKEYIEIPQGVNFSINGNEFTASGKEGSIKKIFRSGAIKKTVDGNKILIETINDRKKSIAEARAIVKHIKNMVSGVNKKFVYKLRVVYSHFPITLAIKGKEFQVNNFVGEKKPRIAKIKDGVNVVIKGKDIIVSFC
jgi:large subunit ribosomal protein L6